MLPEQIISACRADVIKYLRSSFRKARHEDLEDAYSEAVLAYYKPETKRDLIVSLVKWIAQTARYILFHKYKADKRYIPIEHCPKASSILTSGEENIVNRLTYEEIAIRTGKSKNSLEVRMNRVKKKGKMIFGTVADKRTGQPSFLIS
jgi:DNA-directed RNA polymerase specialized sigma24 family protein